MLILDIFSDLTTFSGASTVSFLIVVVAFMAYNNSHLATHLFLGLHVLGLALSS
jgi:hypothetical protein